VEDRPRRHGHLHLDGRRAATPRPLRVSDDTTGVAVDRETERVDLDRIALPHAGVTDAPVVSRRSAEGLAAQRRYPLSTPIAAGMHGPFSAIPHFTTSPATPRCTALATRSATLGSAGSRGARVLAFASPFDRSASGVSCAYRCLAMQSPSAVQVSAPTAPSEQPRRTQRRGAGLLALARPRRVSLVWRVFAGNAMVLVAAAAAIAFSRVTIHASIRLSELAVVVTGLVVMLVVDLLLLRHSLGPLRRLARLMSEVDPQRPGRRAENLEHAGTEVNVVAEAFNGMLDRLETERRASTRRALGAQEEERRWVARELHDEVGQTLTAVALKAGRAARQGGAQAETMSEIAASLQQSLIEVRRMARRLRPEALDDLGLVNAMITMCRRIGDHGALQVDTDFATDLPKLSAETDLVIYRVAQEALTNARRHAQASTVTVTLACEADRVVLSVGDDGRGFDEPVGESNGLAGMRERALMIGAQFDVRSRPGQGAEIRLSIPLAEDCRCPPR